MDLITELTNEGCNTQEGIGRMMGNAAIYEKMVKKFPASLEGQEVLSFIDSGNIEQATMNAHTIKGVTGNLSLTPLYEAYTEIVNLLRKGETAAARSLYEETLPKQNTILEIIKRYM